MLRGFGMRGTSAPEYSPKSPFYSLRLHHGGNMLLVGSKHDYSYVGGEVSVFDFVPIKRATMEYLDSLSEQLGYKGENKYYGLWANGTIQSVEGKFDLEQVFKGHKEHYITMWLVGEKTVDEPGKESGEVQQQESREVQEQESREVQEQESREVQEQESEKIQEQESDEVQEQESREVQEQESEEVQEQESEKIQEQESEEVQDQQPVEGQGYTVEEDANEDSDDGFRDSEDSNDDDDFKDEEDSGDDILDDIIFEENIDKEVEYAGLGDNPTIDNSETNA